MERYFVGLVLAFAAMVAAVVPYCAADDRLIELRNDLFRYERRLQTLLHRDEAPTPDVEARMASMRDKILDLKAELRSGGFDERDVEFAGALEAIREDGRSWILRILTDGTHAPLRPLHMPKYSPELADEIFKKGLGYTLLVILGNDPVCRYAYRRFMPGIEDVVRRMEARLGFRYDYFHPAVRPDEVGFGLDDFWRHARTVGEETANRYFWDGSADEIDHVANFLALVCISGLINHIILETDGDRDELYLRTLWRKNAVPWLETDVSHLPNKFDVHHFMSHASLVYLDLLNRTHWAHGAVVSGRRATEIHRRQVLAGYGWSLAAGVGYEIKSMADGNGFRETVDIVQLPGALRRVAQALGLQRVAGYEACKDIRTNTAGATFGAALFLSGRSIAPSDRALHRDVVGRWLRPSWLRTD